MSVEQTGPPVLKENISSTQSDKLLQQVTILTKTSLRSTKQLEQIRNLQYVRFYIFIGFTVGLLIYLGSVYFSIQYRYSLMIQEINKVVSEGYFTHGTGWQIAFAFEYRGLDIRYGNNFPAAVVYAYYTNEFSTIMRQNQNEILPLMFEIARTGGRGQTGDLSAIDILCAAFQPYGVVRSCQEPCYGPAPYRWDDYVGAIIGFGTQGAFLGFGGGGPGMIIGGIIGGFVGFGVTLAQALEQNAQCQASGGNCIPSHYSQC